MFDDLRQQALSDPEEEKKAGKVEPAAPPQAPAPAAPRARRKPKLILGMTGLQRFAVSALLMLMVCVIGFMFLLLVGKIGF
jgi:hypothetical protein